MSRQKGSPITYVFAAIFIAIIVAMYLAGCAPPRRPPVTQPKPPVAVPTPGPVAPPKPTEPCPDTPDATTGKMDVRWNSARTVAWVDFTPKHNDREDDTTFCLDSYRVEGRWPDGRMLVVCPLRPEGHPERHACDTTKGAPLWFIDSQPADSDPGDPFHVHAPAGSMVKACLAKHPERCLPEIVVTP